MSQINRVSVNNSFFRAKPQDNLQVKKQQTSPALKVGMGVGATALAASGIYLVAHRKMQNIDKAFNEIKNAPLIMEKLKNSKLNPKNFKILMFRITSDEKLSERFINEMVANPKNSKENTRILNKKIGGDKELLEWMLIPKGYQEAYYKHTHNFFKAANHPDVLIKRSPNWNIWKMKEKFGSDFTIGEPPQAFNGTDNYRNVFYKALHTGNVNQNIDGIQFGTYIGGGASGKAVRKLEADGKKYILKYQASDTMHSNQDLKDVASMHSDSTFLNAQLDRYLDLNGYKQGAKLKFFDYKTNSALYEMSEGVNPKREEFYSIVDVNKKLKDLNEYGVYYNDVNAGNFLINDGKISFIDSGEASFVDFFKPGVSGHHFTLPNLNGRSITDPAAALQLSKK